MMENLNKKAQSIVPILMGILLVVAVFSIGFMTESEDKVTGMATGEGNGDNSNCDLCGLKIHDPKFGLGTIKYLERDFQYIIEWEDKKYSESTMRKSTVRTNSRGNQFGTVALGGGTGAAVIADNEQDSSYNWQTGEWERAPVGSATSSGTEQSPAVARTSIRNGWVYSYDGEDKLIERRSIVDKNLWKKYQYDSKGNLVGVTNSDGSVIRYDSSSSRISENHLDSAISNAPSGSESVTYVIDGVRYTEIYNPDGTITRFDSSGIQSGYPLKEISYANWKRRFSGRDVTTRTISSGYSILTEYEISKGELDHIASRLKENGLNSNAEVKLIEDEAGTQVWAGEEYVGRFQNAETPWISKSAIKNANTRAAQKGLSGGGDGGKVDIDYFEGLTDEELEEYFDFDVYSEETYIAQGESGVCST